MAFRVQKWNDLCSIRRAFEFFFIDGTMNEDFISQGKTVNQHSYPLSITRHAMNVS